MSQFPPCPPSLKSIQHYLKTASEHEGRDPVISYWCKYFHVNITYQQCQNEQLGMGVMLVCVCRMMSHYLRYNLKGQQQYHNNVIISYLCYQIMLNYNLDVKDHSHIRKYFV